MFASPVKLGRQPLSYPHVWVRFQAKEFIRISGMTHARNSPFYPQSHGKIERWQNSLKRECIRPLTPLTLEDALGSRVPAGSSGRLRRLVPTICARTAGALGGF